MKLNKRWVVSLFMVAMTMLAVTMPENAQGQDKDIAFWGRIQFVGISAQLPKEHVWGCSPMKGEDGKYHLFGACFKGPFDTGWRTDSHIVHFISDTPTGPFKFVQVVLRGEFKKKGQWNYCGIHNPCIRKVDGKYVLFFIANSFAAPKAERAKPAPSGQSIGMIMADPLDGPWSEPKQILTTSTDPKHWTYQAGMASAILLS